MKRICIIPCGAKKIWDIDPAAGATEARYVYQSPFHKACQTYARTFFADWAILSAKHGFLLPHDQVPGAYDVAFGTKNPEVISLDALIRQAGQKQLDTVDEVVMLGGKKFAPIIRGVFPASRIVFPLAGCKGIGYMLQKLKGAVEQKQEIFEPCKIADTKEA